MGWRDTVHRPFTSTPEIPNLIWEEGIVAEEEVPATQETAKVPEVSSEKETKTETKTSAKPTKGKAATKVVGEVYVPQPTKPIDPAGGGAGGDAAQITTEGT